MEIIKYTKEQSDSIHSRGENLLISAAAGSGKTMVLVKRIIDILIIEKVEIDKMLIVTFTNAAANQMKDKIRDELEKYLASGKYDSRFIRRQLRKVQSSHICTMHSFCIDMIKNYFQHLGVDPNFKIINPSAEIVLKDNALAKVLEEEYENQREDFKNFVEAYGGRKGDRIPEIIDDIYNKIQSEIDPIGWLKENTELLDIELIKAEILSFIKDRIDISIQMIEGAINIANEPDGPSAYLDALENDIELLNELGDLSEKKEYSLLIDRLSTISFARLSSKKVGDESKKNTAKKIRDDVKEIVFDLKKQFETKTEDRILRETEISLIYLKTIERIIVNYDDQLSILKREKRSLSFPDIEHNMVKLLEIEEIRKKIADNIEYIFFDEYQDINPLQEFIIDSIKGDNNLFFVGDIKQSIYRFRLSDPGLFSDRYKKYSKAIINGRNIDLDKNFRSSPKILKYLNFIFESLMSESLGEVDYRQKGQALVPGKLSELDNGRVNLIFNEEAINKEYDDLNPNALYIAKEIKRLVNEGTRDYRDIVILLRSVKGRIEDYEEAFRVYSIPYFSDILNVSLEDPEVSIFIDILKIINNFRNDLALISALLSPVGKLNEDDIARIRIYSNKKSFAEA
ncbi:MAG: UvrD-helicase domain-containing protein, partial [Tissierellia bacterium]|nr:UvrD-helicase domain-containing protein [Tissierellia bacterium]